MDFLKETLKALTGASERTKNIDLAIKRIQDLRPCLAYALEDIKAQTKESREEIPPTEEEQLLINNPLTNNIEVNAEEIIETKIPLEESITNATPKGPFKPKGATE